MTFAALSEEDIQNAIKRKPTGCCIRCRCELEIVARHRDVTDDSRQMAYGSEFVCGSCKRAMKAEDAAARRERQRETITTVDLRASLTTETRDGKTVRRVLTFHDETGRTVHRIRLPTK